MLICLDIGNTSTSYALYKGRSLRKYGRIASDNIPLLTRKLMASRDRHLITNIVVSSVVPLLTNKISKLLSRGRGVRIWVIGRDLRVRIKHKYLRINKLGSDRLVNVYGAIKLYGPPLLILDYGTALTGDYISGKGIYEGGLIIPGPEIALKALSAKAALLPEIPFPYKATGLIGRDTKSGMKSGILNGYGALTDGVVERFRKRFGQKFRVVATGGLAEVVARFSSRIDTVDPLLTLKGIRELFLDQVKIPS